MKQNKKNNIFNRISTIVFMASQLYWLFWIGCGIYYAITGVYDNMFPSIYESHMIYGTKTIGWTILNMFLVTIQTPFILIPIYQVAFCLISSGKKIAKIIKKGK